jgi:hypothetical protein
MIFFCCFIGFIFLLLGEILVQRLFDWSNILLDSGIGNRFTTEGLETARYNTWLAAINQMWDFPWGGRAMNIESSYAHNIWLDQLYDAGILPMFLLLTFHIVQIPTLIQFFKLKLPFIIHVFVLCTLLAFLAAFLQAPVIQASPVYFAISCFFFGSVARLTADIKFKVKQI